MAGKNVKVIVTRLTIHATQQDRSANASPTAVESDVDMTMREDANQNHQAEPLRLRNSPDVNMSG
jgi:hypothetical protein